MARLRALFLLIILSAATVSTVAAQATVVAPVAPVRSWEVVAEFPHDTGAFTEGLQIVDGKLYESTGLFGRSSLRLVDLATGEVIERHSLEQTYFGEGLTILGDKIYQLTWQTGVAFVYDLETFEQIGTFTYDTEGWGLTTDGESLIMGDGTDQIFFRDPETFEVTRQITVRDGDSPVVDINELEYIDGVIWANIWKTSYIARIDPKTGQVIDWLDLSALTSQMAASGERIDVLNGIAWDPDTGAIYVTGKFWPTLFQIQLTDD